MPKKTSAIRTRAIDPRLRKIRDLVEEVADEQCGPSASYEERTEAFRRLMEALLSELSQERADANKREDPER